MAEYVAFRFASSSSALTRFRSFRIATALELEREASAFGYLDFLKTPANRMRLFLVIWVGLIVQWVSSRSFSSFLVPIAFGASTTSY